MQTTRRGFIQGAAVAAGGTAAPWLASLAAIGEAAAQSVGTDGEYKALVCLFMLGGNDHANTLVPMDAASYDIYRSQRPEIYYQKDQLRMGGTEGSLSTGVSIFPGIPPVMMNLLSANVLADNHGVLNGRQFALAPPLTPLKTHYTSGKLAVMLNVGPLIEPTVGVKNESNGTVELRPLNVSTQKADLSRAALVPKRLGSHNDQVIVWGSEQGGASEGTTAGWGGLIADAVSQGNTMSVFNGISAGGSTVFLSGSMSNAYQVTTGNSIAVSFDSLRSPIYGSAAVSGVLAQIITGSGTVSGASHVMEQDLVRVTKRAISSGDILRGIPIDSVKVGDASPYAPLKIDGNGLADQLRTVAHLINSRATTGAKRQVFFVAMGGFDTHSRVPADHPGLTAKVAQAMNAFQQVMDSLQMSNQVTLFTASEFGRTLNANGDGSDHGWGSMHFVLGGAVNGGRFYGKAPVFGNQAQRPDDGYYDDTTRGSLIPTTSVAQYAATLARWMGVPDSQLDTILPNLKNFNHQRDLGFLKRSV